MAALSDLPDHVLETVLRQLHATGSFYNQPWLLALRLVNRKYTTWKQSAIGKSSLPTGQFNEAVLHVVFFEGRPSLFSRHHTIECDGFCEFDICRAEPNLEVNRSCMPRFVLQSLLARHDLPGVARHVNAFLNNLRQALLLLRQAVDIGKVDKELSVSLSVCTKISVFNDIISAILASAVECYLGSARVLALPLQNGEVIRPRGFHLRPPPFWVALAACYLGDLEMLRRFESKNISGYEDVLDQDDDSERLGYLMLAIERKAIDIIDYLLKPGIDAVTGGNTDFTPLRAALLCGDCAILQMLLQHTSNSSRIVSRALNTYLPLFNEPNSSRTAVQILIEHFSPLSEIPRTRLLYHACILGDVEVVKEVLTQGPIKLILTPCRAELVSFKSLHYDVAARQGNIKLLEFMLKNDRVVMMDTWTYSAMISAARTALFYNHLNLWQSIQAPLREPEDLLTQLAIADGSEQTIKDIISRDPNIVSRQLHAYGLFGIRVGELALFNALYRLRWRNAEVLLDAGVRRPVARYPGERLEFEWSFYERHRDAFERTQRLLRLHDVPPLRLSLLCQ